MNRILGVLLLVGAPFLIGSYAQSGPPTLGTVSVPTTGNCTGSGWITGSGVTCAHTFVDCTSATGAVSLGITYAYETPSSPKGTIVFFSGGDGTNPNGAEPTDSTHSIQQYADDYYAVGYQVVQTAWDTEWEDPTSTNSGGNIGYAACRPATFLSWVRFGSTGNPGLWTTGGMCAQGESAGSGAGAYSLAWYGAGSGTGTGYNYLDKLSILSGPPFSSIAAGCTVIGGESPVVQVCPAGQLGCNPNNNPSSWNVVLSFGAGPAADINDWSGIHACSQGPNTPSQDTAAWKAMSIADGHIGTFSYPQTYITSWLCSSVESPNVMNESSPEGQMLVQNFTSSSQLKGLIVNGVSNCANSEFVGGGTPPSNYGVQYGWQAIEKDMEDSTKGCVSHH
jgi:hypothetical protein